MALVGPHVFHVNGSAASVLTDLVAGIGVGALGVGAVAVSLAPGIETVIEIVGDGADLLEFTIGIHVLASFVPGGVVDLVVSLVAVLGHNGVVTDDGTGGVVALRLTPETSTVHGDVPGLVVETGGDGGGNGESSGKLHFLIKKL